MPEKLYQYQPISDNRLNTLLNSEICFSKAENLNDPFDCLSYYYDEIELTNVLKQKLPPNKIEKGISNIIEDLLGYFRSKIKLTCFTDDPFNMPMWAHYGDNHQGICIEYDFTQLDYENDFSKMLFPVRYETKRYNATNLIKISFDNMVNQKIK